jgi:tRNA(Ile)-lysidine synthase
VLAAVSGGSDSVALLHLLLELQERGDLTVVAVAHLNHRLRGGAADLDEAFCRALGASLDLPVIVESVDVAAAARADRTSVEQAGHRLRHEFFARAAAASAAASTAVGHTRDDQAETFLLRLLRGAGPVGLGGMHPRTGSIVRPLLDVARDELRAYLAERRIEFREDESNLDPAIPRNRVRHELLPLLRDRFSPGIVDTLSREAAIARDDAEYFESIVASVGETVVSGSGGDRVLDVAALAACPSALARRIVRHAMEEVAPGRFVGFDAVEAVLDLADPSGKGPRRVDAPGQRVERIGENVVLRSRPGRAAPDAGPEAQPFSYALSVPGEVDLPEAGCAISAELGSAAVDPADLHAEVGLAVVAASEMAPPLTVRNRHAGDVFRPMGLGGRKKLQDFFVDRKVQRRLRDRVPLVVDGRGRIVWVAGLAVGDEFRVTDASKGVVILRLRQLGGEG